MMDGINKVIQHINSIERRFGCQATDATSFSAHLEAEQRKALTTPQAQSSEEDVMAVIKQAAAKYGVDPRLALAVAQTESGLSPDALSPSGAVGVMQLMPGTAQALGVHNTYDVQQNIDGGVRYLRQLLDTFGGDIEKTLAAYNSGPQAVKLYGGVPPYSETKDYIAKVRSLYG